MHFCHLVWHHYIAVSFLVCASFGENNANEHDEHGEDEVEEGKLQVCSVGEQSSMQDGTEVVAE